MGILNNNVRRKSRRRNRANLLLCFMKISRLVVYKVTNTLKQIINDFEARTIASASSKDSSLKKQVSLSKSKTEVSKIVGKAIAERAKK